MFDFCERVDSSACNRAAIETLIKAGRWEEAEAAGQEAVSLCTQLPTSLHREQFQGEMARALVVEKLASRVNRFKQAQAAYEEGDEAYLARDYGRATDKYREAIEIVDPLLGQVDGIFAKAYADGLAALEAADTVEALRQLELAAAISSKSRSGSPPTAG